MYIAIKWRVHTRASTDNEHTVIGLMEMDFSRSMVGLNVQVPQSFDALDHFLIG